MKKLITLTIILFFVISCAGAQKTDTTISMEQLSDNCWAEWDTDLEERVILDFRSPLGAGQIFGLVAKIYIIDGVSSIYPYTINNIYFCN